MTDDVVDHLQRELEAARSEYAEAVDRHAHELEALRRQLTAQLEAAQHRLVERIRLHEQDIRIIGDRLVQEAEDREWCDTYDDVVGEMNQQLHVELPTRHIWQEFQATASLRVKVHPNHRSARSDARAMVVEELSRLDEGDYHWEIEGVNVSEP